MPPDPEKPIEKLLRHWSRRRRDAAKDSWEIHPATRKLWQQAVAQRFGRKQEPKPGWFAGLMQVGWVRPAGALCGVLLLTLAVWSLFLRPSPKSSANMASSQAASGLFESNVQVALNEK